MIPVIALFNKARSLYGIRESEIEAIVERMKPAYINYFDFASNSTTTITDVATWVKLNTVTTKGFSRNGLEHTNNRVTNTGTKKVFRFTGFVSLASNNNNEIHVAFFKNGAIVPCSEQSVVTNAAGRRSAIPFVCNGELDTEDFVEVYVKNQTSEANITIDNLNVEIIER